jgi:hypothetical protein
MRFRTTRKRQRGAALVEALMVISFLILGFMGLIFFRELYRKQLTAMRLARASLIAHSMTACRDDSAPVRWLGRADLGRYRAGPPGQQAENASDSSSSHSMSAGQQAGTILGRVGGVSGNGRGVVNPITTSEVSGHTSVETGGGLFSRGRRVFEGNLRSRSYVTCSDPVRDGEFTDVLGYVRGVIR